MKSRSRKYHGFTLVELILTLVVIGIVLAVGLPGITRMKERSELITASSSLVAALNLARSEAARRGQNVEVRAQSNDQTNWEAGWDVQYLDPVTNNNVLIRTFPATSANLQISTDGANITFLPTGGVATVRCFDISASSGSGVRSVPVTAAGRVNTCGASCTDIQNDPTSCTW